MKIGKTDIESIEQPYLIAEIGVNHFDIAEERDITALEAAKKMIESAALAGADAVKFQSYSADELASTNSSAYWDTDKEEILNQHQLFSKYDGFGAQEFEQIASWTADNHEVEFLSTPFDFHAVDYLEDLVPAYKIASADVTHHPLLRHITRKGKPILLSTGASTVAEIDEALQVIKSEDPDSDICLLHCILEYPTDPENANLGMIDHLSDVFPEPPVGYSDHVPPDEGMITLLNAERHGAVVIEKHFTLNKSLPGNDHYHAMDPDDLRTFRRNSDLFSTTTGKQTKSPIAEEEDSRKHARRSLVAAVNIAEGTQIKREHIAIKRPGTGISPKMIDYIIGQTAKIEISPDEILQWDSI